MGDSGGPIVGSQAPEFTALQVTPDGSVSEVTLSSLLSDGAVLLVFQPTNFELSTFTERHALGEYDWFTTDSKSSESTAPSPGPTGSSWTTST